MVISPKRFKSLEDAKAFVQKSEQDFEKRLEFGCRLLYIYV